MTQHDLSMWVLAVAETKRRGLQASQPCCRCQRCSPEGTTHSIDAHHVHALRTQDDIRGGGMAGKHTKGLSACDDPSTIAEDEGYRGIGCSETGCSETAMSAELPGLQNMWRRTPTHTYTHGSHRAISITKTKAGQYWEDLVRGVNGCSRRGVAGGDVPSTSFPWVTHLGAAQLLSGCSDTASKLSLIHI